MAQEDSQKNTAAQETPVDSSPQEVEESQPEAEEPHQETPEQGMGALMSPEGCLMLSLAVIIDCAGLIEFIPIAGNVISWILDITGLIIIGGWMLYRSHQVSAPARAQKKVASLAKKAKNLRPLMILLEFIPFVGIFSWWTIAVYMELKSSAE